jgi:2-oxoglutarate dehydrogenase E2 component (dihydrolipoamide succinyltransferase)
MAKVDVIMPQMGESIAEGTLTRWMKGVGDAVDRDEDLFEISTDKVDADIPSPAAGVLAEILVQEGETVEVNTIVARIETEVGAVAEPAAPAPAQEEPRVEAPATVAAAEPAAPAAAAPVEPAGIATEPDAAEPQPSTAGAATRDERLSTRSTPLVRKIAAEHGVDITQIQGSGISGRVTRDDILSYLESGGGAAPTAEPEPVVAAAPAPTAAPSPTPPTTAAPATAVIPPAAPVEMGAPGFMQVPIHGATLDIRIPPVVVRENDRVEEMNRVRLRTMEHMLMSQSISAHVTSVTEIDFERVVRLRRKLKSKYAEQGVKLTYGPFIMKAVIEALLEYPILNASVDGTRVVYHGDINLGIAVAVNDGKELIVPVLKNADRLSLMGLAEGANVLAEKARTKTLDFDDIQGGTFTITNVGVFGNLFGTPIINQPQVAILGTGVIEKRPVVVADQMGSDAIGIRHMSYFGLSYDHRVVDGAVAAFWLNKVQEVLENFPEDSI